MNTRQKTVAIVGATGITGGFAFDAAAARQLLPVAVGRNRAKLEGFLRQRGLNDDRMRIADVHDAAALQRSLVGVDAVISTVAPFTHHGFPVAAAAAALGIGYVDSTGESRFIQQLIDRLDSSAMQSGATLCAGNGAAAFLGDILIRWMSDRSSQSSGAVLYDIQKYRPTFGSLQSYLTGILPAGGPAIRDGKVEFFPFAAFSGQVAGEAGLHSVIPDALVISRYWPARRFDGLFRGAPSHRAMISAVSRALIWPPLTRLLMHLPLKRMGTYDRARDQRSTVKVIAEVRDADGSTRRRAVAGKAIYPLTGAILAATAQAMLAHPQRPTGVRAASEMFQSFDEALQATGIEEMPPDPDWGRLSFHTSSST